jgi:hypothetical protein
MRNILLLICLINSITIWGQTSIRLGAPSFLAESEKGLPEFNLKKTGPAKFRFDSAYIYPRITLQLGAGIMFSDREAQLNSGISTGTKLDLEDDLGLKSSQVIPRVNVIFRLSRLSRIYFDFYSARGKDSKNIEKDITFGSAFFPTGTSVSTKMSAYNFHLAYAHSFINRKKFDFGGLLGVSAIDYSLKLEGGPVSDKGSTLFFFPHIGADASVFITKRFFFRGVVKFSASPIDNYDFTVLSIKPYVEYYFTDNIGAGVRYHYNYSKADQLSKDKFDGNFGFNFHQVALFVSFRFF